MTQGEEIQPGQFWSEPDGGILFVTGRNGNNTGWLVNRISLCDLVVEATGERNLKFVQKLEPRAAKKIALTLLESNLFQAE